MSKHTEALLKHSASGQKGGRKTGQADNQNA